MEIELDKFDPEVSGAIQGEIDRERNYLVMIASENYVSRAVIEAQANVMTNKYAEGYPDKRYYGGCENVDVVEKLAKNRAMALFKADYVNVQPHSGSQANMAVYFAALKPGDTILGMDLSHGGHLTHGSRASFSGNIYKSVSYGLDPETQLIDYDQVYTLAKQNRPGIIVVGASAYPRSIDFVRFKEIAVEVDAYLMADIAHIAGLIAAGLHPSPVGVADFITATTHKTLRGPRGGLIMADKELGQAIDKSIFPGIQGGPFMHIIAAKAVCFKEAQMPEFKSYQQQVISNARLLAEELMGNGFHLVSGGTDNHLILIDLSSKGITGLEAEKALGAAGIYTNKNSIPYDKKSPRITSGLRIGTPALTTRGMKEKEMKLIAGFINKVLEDPDNEKVINNVRMMVSELCNHFPIYGFMDQKKIR
ncbi:MAG: serine hydroxymethyltransferase [Deltaproteobacteria bacterium]|nr:serine hydroxymethyltransferase [Deltaproteobacteria bacterium]